MTVLDKEHNVYATIEAPATIDATFDKLQDEYGVVLPLIDLSTPIPTPCSWRA